MFSYSTEVTSSKIISDNPLYQRTLKAYHIVSPHVTGNVLEIGSGEGYGISLLHKNATHLTLVDKSPLTAKIVQEKYTDITFIQEKIPPLTNLPSNSFDTVISFQVIEHIKDVKLYIKEIYRVLKPGGKAFISTPNAKKTVARNPWHYKEFTFDEIEALVKQTFSTYSIKGIEGNTKTDEYYEKNREAVKRFMRFDIFNLQHKLPAFLLQIPYEVANRMNRKKLLHQNNTLVNSITLEDYSLNDYSEATLDFFCELQK